MKENVDYCMGCLEYSSPFNIEEMENFCFLNFTVRIVRDKEKCYNINVIMEIIPNTWNNADRLCEILKCTKEELPDRVLMEKGLKEPLENQAALMYNLLRSDRN